MTIYPANQPQRNPSHPGELLPDIIKEMGFSVTSFAKALQISRGMLNKIISTEKPIRTEIALKLGALVGNGPNLWLNMQKNYDLWKTEKELKPVLKEIEKIRAAG